MTEVTEQICVVIENVLKSTSAKDALSAPVTAESGLSNPPEWDSLSFVSVFLAVTEHFDLEVDDEDAIYFRSVQEILTFMQSTQ